MPLSHLEEQIQLTDWIQDNGKGRQVTENSLLNCKKMFELTVELISYTDSHHLFYR